MVCLKPKNKNDLKREGVILKLGMTIPNGYEQPYGLTRKHEVNFALNGKQISSLKKLMKAARV